MRRSANSGRTWGPVVVIVDDNENTCGNPCPVVDEETGEFCCSTRGTSVPTSNLASTRASRAARVRSGWPRARTTAVPGARAVRSRPKPRTRPGAGTRRVRAWASSSGRAPRRALGHSLRPLGALAEGEETNVAYGSHTIFSDDHGATWQRSEALRPNVNECQVVELEGGSLMLNMRSYAGNNRRRIATSNDGGATWSQVADDPTLIEPVCQASISRLAWSGPHGKSRILFANPASVSRERMTVRLSYDEAGTWPVDRLVYRGSSAYSCLVPLPDQSFGLLFEADGYGRIAFAQLTLEWLTDGEDSLGGK